MQRDEIGLRQQSVERDVLHAEFALGFRLAARPPIEDLHAEAARAARGRLADAADADQADGLAVHEAAGEMVRLRAGEFAGAHQRSPSIMRRATAIISPKWMSAVASATIGGTTVTGMPRLVASATSILSGVIDIEATARNFGLARSTARSIVSCSSENRMSHFFTAAISFGLAMILLESVLILTSAIVAQARRARSARSAG